MSEPIRVVHYLNQFFGGFGAEEKANTPVEIRDGPLGPGRALQQALGEQATIAATLVGGDNYMSEHQDAALATLRAALADLCPDVLVAGPAFDAGRYGVACGEVCKLAGELGIPAVTAMYPENPGVPLFHRDVPIVPTSANAAGMAAAVAALARLVLKLGQGEPLGPADADGYLGRGIRVAGRRTEPGHRRAVAMLHAKLAGRPFATELPIHATEAVTPASPIADLSKMTLALITTGGLVPKGNPDRLSAANSRQWYRYSIEGLDLLSATDWDCVHRGFYTAIVKENPNYIVPLHVVRHLERAGAIGGVYPWFFSTSGVGTPDSYSKPMGQEMAAELKQAGVDAALLVAT
ncbi:MAG: glycine/betaine/sarcosine/D-proline family reductase selenoprotein B [Chloroflexi bacterium]|nr:glycine/betaine/sarcosine/D-proline family reductase selenoprotein B [Chloroflexota bacterium]